MTFLLLGLVNESIMLIFLDPRDLVNAGLFQKNPVNKTY